VFTGLFSSVWWPWAGFTFYANRFDTDDVVYRLAKLGAMLAVAGLAASASDATGSLAGQFAVCHAAIRVVLVCLYLRAYVATKWTTLGVVTVSAQPERFVCPIVAAQDG
jgi:low temperature requirement protein LtrA